MMMKIMNDLKFIKEIKKKDKRINIIKNKKKWELEIQEILDYLIQKENILLF